MGYSYNKGQSLNHIDFTKLTHAIAFTADPMADGSVGTSFYGAGESWAKDIANRAHAAGRKSLLAIGGWNESHNFPSAMSSGNRDKFTTNLVNTAKRLGFDGITIDWERNLHDNLEGHRLLGQMLRQKWPDGIFDTCLDNDGIGDQAYWAATHPHFDRISIMTYVMAGNWEGWLSWHSSALKGGASQYPATVESGMAQFVNRGIPKSKLNAGAFFGGVKFLGASAPRQQYGSGASTGEEASFDYINSLSGTANWDDAAKVPWKSIPNGYWSFEDGRSLQEKGAWIKANGFGGCIIWDAPGGASLLPILYNAVV
jgi:chitinase